MIATRHIRRRSVAFGLLGLSVAAAPGPAALGIGTPAETAAAFRVAFAKTRQPVADNDGVERIYTPGKLVTLSDGRLALISAGRRDDAGHADSGAIAVHYLSRAGTGFSLIKAWINAGGGSTFGAAPTFTVSGKFGTDPVIVTEGGGTWQGYSCSTTMLIALTPAGPAEVASLPTTYSNSGAVDGKTTLITGHITNIRTGAGFDVAYTGSRRFTETYIRKGSKFVLKSGGESRMDTC